LTVSSPDPAGTFYDAELVYGGQCYYESTTFAAIDSTLSMSYRTPNGDPVSPLSLYEFGSDTGEGAYNLAALAGPEGYNVSVGRVSFPTDYLTRPDSALHPTFPFSIAGAAIVGLAMAALAATFPPVRRRLR